MSGVMRDWLPHAALRAIRLWRRRAGFRGPYASWQEARGAAAGYDDRQILHWVLEAARKVKHGEATFERDGTCFHHEEYRWEVVACLMLSAAASGGRLHVMDFGGALGGFYVQHRRLLSEAGSVHWGVVEQPHYVEAGRAEFEDECLRFFSSIEECAQAIAIEVVLLSSVLPYLETPYEHLERIAASGARHVIVDRTAFRRGVGDRIFVQVVDRKAFPTDVPMWALSEEGFDQAMDRLGYSRLARIPFPESETSEFAYSGMLYRRRTG